MRALRTTYCYAEPYCLVMSTRKLLSTRIGRALDALQILGPLQIISVFVPCFLFAFEPGVSNVELPVETRDGPSTVTLFRHDGWLPASLVASGLVASILVSHSLNRKAFLLSLQTFPCLLALFNMLVEIIVKIVIKHIACSGTDLYDLRWKFWDIMELLFVHFPGSLFLCASDSWVTSHGKKIVFFCGIVFQVVLLLDLQSHVRLLSFGRDSVWLPTLLLCSRVQVILIFARALKVYVVGKHFSYITPVYVGSPGEFDPKSPQIRREVVVLQFERLIVKRFRVIEIRSALLIQRWFRSTALYEGTQPGKRSCIVYNTKLSRRRRAVIVDAGVQVALAPSPGPEKKSHSTGSAKPSHAATRAADATSDAVCAAVGQGSYVMKSDDRDGGNLSQEFPLCEVRSGDGGNTPAESVQENVASMEVSTPIEEASKVPPMIGPMAQGDGIKWSDEDIPGYKDGDGEQAAVGATGSPLVPASPEPIDVFGPSPAPFSQMSSALSDGYASPDESLCACATQSTSRSGPRPFPDELSKASSSARKFLNLGSRISVLGSAIVPMAVKATPEMQSV
eukprot:CAMPEP_0117550990 /NCGR_PEP_ID=MMETSP0784-20121206/48961_1 /TAXON_ID=39447 /ORGANISM="" /LENGTH=564 /DNA_ID=CAMNT_0005348017 /DNA_START=17 /DNA_END=1711 /DNA_ORIENTATION=-